MFAYILRRIAAVIPVALVVATFVFLLTHLGSSDPAAVIAGDFATAEDVAKIRHHLGLDRPLYEQFWIWMIHLLRGDLGNSIYSNMPVTKLIFQRLEPTFLLAIMSSAIAVIVAIPLGVIAAWKAGTWIDRLVMIFSVLAFSFPVFFIGYLMIYGFSLKTGLFPIQGYASIKNGIGPFLWYIFQPSLALGAVYAALIARITRASMIEVLHEDYIQTAKAKGVPVIKMLLVHALKNASVPITTVIGIGVSLLISGVVITESVFVIPGVGRLTADAIIQRDYPIIQGVVLLFSFTYVVINLIVDIIYSILDPRIQY
ncbi:MAG: ABC transporter permease [Desulfarculaceae bacterium]